MKLLRALADALVAALFVVTCESVVVAFVFRRELVGPWEMRQALRVLLPIGWAVTVPVAILGAIALGLVRASRRHAAARVILTVLAATFALAVGLGVTEGRHFSSLWLRAPFVLALMASAGGITYGAAPRASGRMATKPWAAGAFAIVFVVVVSLTNALVLPRLYPAFHAGLALLTLLVTPAIALLWSAGDAPASLGSQLYAGLVPLLAIAAIVFTPALARKLARADNVRFLYGERAPLLRYAALLIGEIVPAEGTEDARAAGERAPEEAHAIDLRGRDIVLISVDALRADHVGAYGYARPTTPHLDALAKEGTRFDYAYCATPHTSYSVTSMLTGKYMRPLLLEGAGKDSDTLAKLLRTYGYRTAGFYPPAVFFIDAERFASFKERGLDFEYRRVEFTSAESRAQQVASYLDDVRSDRRVLLWVHLFEPHEPYEKHEAHDFGDRDVDRYDSEIAAADDGIGAIVTAVRAKRPGAAIVITADHGEEHGEHGGRYHGTSVYEEQVRVPLIVVAPGVVPERVVERPVETIDILPTLLSALRIPRPARVRGRDLTALLSTEPAQEGPGFAYAETDETTLLAEDSFRLLCARRLGVCRLFDLRADPEERRDVSAREHDRFVAMRAHMREVESAHGRYELAGLRVEGKAWPEPIRRGLAGDVDAWPDIAALLDDADVAYRRKASEVLFELAWPGDSAPTDARPPSAMKGASAQLGLALTRDEDDTVRKWSGLALTRLGEGAGRSLELVDDKDPAWRRRAALALAETGDARGEATLVSWWQTGELPFERARQVAAALGKIRSKRALVPLLHSLADVRLRPYLAAALAAIGESAARPALLDAFAAERYVPTRRALGNALVSLGAGGEMAVALTRFLGTPDPLPDGVALALAGDFLPSVGGPDDKMLARLTEGRAGVARIAVIIPRGGRGDGAVRLTVRGRSLGALPVTLRIGLPVASSEDGPVDLDPRVVQAISLPAAEHPTEVAITLAPALGAKPGKGMSFAIDRPEGVEIDGMAVVPLFDELPPPPPEPWTPSLGDRTEHVVDDGT